MNLPNSNWQDHNAAQQRAMNEAQKEYDARMPPEDPNCDEDGHRWHLLPGESKDGTRFKKCRKCGATEEN
jgi:DNA-directed RNA polymerase subunit M/transcription elongation factor TFIIS